MSDKVFNVLFICSGNSARSIMAEAILNREGKGHFRGWSAGSFPKGAVHPEALRVLENLDYDVSSFRSKSWDEFSGPDAPHFDFIVTVCDEAAGEACPVWPGHPMSAHWGVPDPARSEETHHHAEIAVAFDETYRMLHQRILIFVALPLASLDHMALHDELHAIGRMAGAT
ncbi:MAG: arsenate reductase ArsC, partial [Bauldia sp.]